MPLRHACADGDFIVCNRGRAARNFAQRQANADASPKATVPVLVLSNGNVIDESLDSIMTVRFKAALDRYKYSNRFTNETIDVLDQRAICATTFLEYETRLSQTPYLLGNKATIADNAIFPFVRQCANVDRDWFDAQPWPHLRQWLEGFLSSARFDIAMRKLAPWQIGDSPLILR
ncbi:hypothetical protein GQR58_030448 [Nymphon striatum]|nr:hypothetical protein GQR58_030448 [Nymphon striatum]